MNKINLVSVFLSIIPSLSFSVIVSAADNESYTASAEYKEALSQFEYFKNELPSKLAESNNYRDNLAAALLSQGGSGELVGFEYPLIKALQKAPSDPLLLFSIIDFCKTKQHKPFCDIQSLQTKFQASDPDNALPWLIATSLAIENDDQVKIIDYLQLAANAKFYNGYYSEYIELFRDAIGPNASYSQEEVDVAAIGLAAAQSLGFHWVYKICLNKDEIKLDEYLILCNKIGSLLETTGKSWIVVSIGMGLQKRTAHLFAEPEQRLKNIALRKAVNERSIQAHTALMPKFPYSEEDTFENLLFVDDVVEFGELEAMERAITRLSTQSTKNNP
jgi:hypothetical protein